jgi:hypothetical protein
MGAGPHPQVVVRLLDLQIPENGVGERGIVVLARVDQDA